MRSIDEGEEITICYMDPGQPRDARRARLRTKFGFECECSLCSLTGEALNASNERQLRIGEIDVITARGDDDSRPHPQMVPLVTEKLRLLKAEGLPEAWGHMDMVCAFARCCVDGDRAAAHSWMHRAIKAARILLGDDAQVIKDLQQIVHHH